MTTSTERQSDLAPHYLTFADIDAPLILNGDAPLIDLIREVLPGWPFVVSHSEPDETPFFTVDATDNDRQYLCLDKTTDGAKPRTLDPANAVCDMVAAMSRALPASQATLICLHAAAIEVSGRLVVIPNARRAGKSTLAAYLAYLGHPVFTDDFLPVSFDHQGTLVGRANGVSPRLRLPLPDALPADFKIWALGNPGPSNKQYKYLSLDGTPPGGTQLPVGAIVLIEREDDASAAALQDLPTDDAMEALLRQNFTRDVHSAAVLSVMERLMATLPVKRLRYSNAQDAAACIADTFGNWATPVETSAARAGMVFERAAEPEALRGGIQSDKEITQIPGAAAAIIGDAVYLSDPNGAGIHRLNPVSRAIWLLLGEPMTPDQIVEVLQIAFPDVPPSGIRDDTTRFLSDLARAGLIRLKGA